VGQVRHGVVLRAEREQLLLDLDRARLRVRVVRGEDAERARCGVEQGLSVVGSHRAVRDVSTGGAQGLSMWAEAPACRPEAEA
jgi:hypothetical protein